MLRKTVVRLVRDPVPDDTKAFYSWFSGQAYRQERVIPGGYPAVRVYPVYGKRWFTGRTVIAIIAGISLFGAWVRPEKERYNLEMLMEFNERNISFLPYQEAEMHLRAYLSAYKRHRYEQECIVDKGFVGLTSEFRKFFYHDDVFRPPMHDVLMHPWTRFGGPFNSYNWTIGYF
ncbi:NADH dehydrogenase subunit NB6M [Angomonas deanei]|uniref:NADH dehydrogenase [ubiquinone] 1 alpha subcomplex subunit 13 n=1 Tax=Angomonas deanei TaxID=59799 RepID=S9WSD0_9TRYP|nr:NADH dehydrogenase subunit NB6M [Angomonas deanei]EPY41153.1 NADH dehydrogenase subunit NB6M [Angomonas deanei]EPY42356.1 NADH dehydrogenase subunit NB6M [Angomonas deanei]CAD2218812.1 GRIM-19 protein, putative [Angomonas deanei]|eukprot:EPY31187.1 NADH dehydrogenase subunit NB6M [Angomonas deanei]